MHMPHAICVELEPWHVGQDKLPNKPDAFYKIEYSIALLKSQSFFFFACLLLLLTAMMYSGLSVLFCFMVSPLHLDSFLAQRNLKVFSLLHEIIMQYIKGPIFLVPTINRVCYKLVEVDLSKPRSQKLVNYFH